MPRAFSPFKVDTSPCSMADSFAVIELAGCPRSPSASVIWGSSV